MYCKTILLTSRTSPTPGLSTITTPFYKRKKQQHVFSNLGLLSPLINLIQVVVFLNEVLSSLCWLKTVYPSLM